MKLQSEITRQKLVQILNIIENNAYPHDEENWGGADVAILQRLPKPSTNEGFYPDPRQVVTLFSHELSWLFKSLWQVMRPYFDGCSKIEFFGRLANMAIRYKDSLRGAQEVEGDLLKAVTFESFRILDEIEKREFCCLPLAIGNTIYDDIEKNRIGRDYPGKDFIGLYFAEERQKFKDTQ